MRTTSSCMVAGTRADAEALRDEVAAVLAPMGLRLSDEKTTIAHIDEGFDFLGWRIQRHRKRGADKQSSTPSRPRGARLHHGHGARRSPARARTNRSPTCCAGSTRCCGAGPTTSGTACPRPPSATSTPTPGAGSSAGSAASTPGPTGSGSDAATSPRWWPTEGDVTLFDPGACASPATATGEQRSRRHGTIGRPDRRMTRRHELVESRMRWKPHVRFGERAGETDQRKAGTAPRPDPPLDCLRCPGSGSARSALSPIELSSRSRCAVVAFSARSARTRTRHRFNRPERHESFLAAPGSRGLAA